MSPDTRPVLVMAGGTGGHIFPGLAVADALTARGIPVAWLGAVGGLEERLVPRHHLPLETLAIGGVRGKGLGTALAAPLRLGRAVLGARGVLRRLQPRSVLSMGGYAAAPGGLAARLARVPLVVHEQNSVAGATNRMRTGQLHHRVLGGVHAAGHQLIAIRADDIVLVVAEQLEQAIAGCARGGEVLPRLHGDVAGARR